MGPRALRDSRTLCLQCDSPDGAVFRPKPQPHPAAAPPLCFRICSILGSARAPADSPECTPRGAHSAQLRRRPHNPPGAQGRRRPRPAPPSQAPQTRHRPPRSGHALLVHLHLRPLLPRLRPHRLDPRARAWRREHRGCRAPPRERRAPTRAHVPPHAARSRPRSPRRPRRIARRRRASPARARGRERRVRCGMGGRAAVRARCRCLMGHQGPVRGRAGTGTGNRKTGGDARCAGTFRFFPSHPLSTQRSSPLSIFPHSLPLGFLFRVIQSRAAPHARAGALRVCASPHHTFTSLATLSSHSTHAFVSPPDRCTSVVLRRLAFSSPLRIDFFFGLSDITSRVSHFLSFPSFLLCVSPWPEPLCASSRCSSFSVAPDVIVFSPSSRSARPRALFLVAHVFRFSLRLYVSSESFVLHGATLPPHPNFFVSVPFLFRYSLSSYCAAPDASHPSPLPFRAVLYFPLLCPSLRSSVHLPPCTWSSSARPHPPQPRPHTAHPSPLFCFFVLSGPLLRFSPVHLIPSFSLPIFLSSHLPASSSQFSPRVFPSYSALVSPLTRIVIPPHARRLAPRPIPLLRLAFLSRGSVRLSFQRFCRLFPSSFGAFKPGHSRFAHPPSRYFPESRIFFF
ncbi:hypothetical protein FB451DRAFT_445297 [Mycena latifolia]|nr:hypothetical protein FB451DRAFT_445297 [Mycena latifolia]